MENTWKIQGGRFFCPPYCTLKTNIAIQIVYLLLHHHETANKDSGWPILPKGSIFQRIGLNMFEITRTENENCKVAPFQIEPARIRSNFVSLLSSLFFSFWHLSCDDTTIQSMYVFLLGHWNTSFWDAKCSLNWAQTFIKQCSMCSADHSLTCRPVSPYPCPPRIRNISRYFSSQNSDARPPWPAHMAIGPSGESEMRNFRNNKKNVHDVSILFKKMKSMVIYIKQSMSLIKRLNLMK